MSTHTISELQQWQRLPLSIKEKMTCRRIRDWVHEYGQSGCYVSFSGGKDSTVLLDLVRNKCGYDDITAMFVDVPTQYPELKEFVKTFNNVDIVKSKMSFYEVCQKYGFPIISKEVSECVEGARKYLRELSGGGTKYKYFYNKLSGQGEYAKPKQGGYDNKYRKLRGIGEYSKRTNGKQRGRQQSTLSDNVRVADKGQEPSDKGEYP